MRRCDYCGANFEPKKPSAKTRFCSVQCKNEGLSIPLEVKFERSIQRTPECWLWMGQIRPNGYGCIPHRRKNVSPHRFAFEQAKGPIPKGMQVCHTCDNRRCVNPDHLFLGDAFDNMRDMINKGRGATGARHGRHTMPERTARGERSGKRLHPEAYPKGEKVYNAKLNGDVVKTIRRMHEEGTPDSVIAELFSVSRATVHSVRTGKTWAHIS